MNFILKLVWINKKENFNVKNACDNEQIVQFSRNFQIRFLFFRENKLDRTTQ